MNNRKNAVESATKEMQNAVNTYNGVSGVWWRSFAWKYR